MPRGSLYDGHPVDAETVYEVQLSEVSYPVRCESPHRCDYCDSFDFQRSVEETSFASDPKDGRLYMMVRWCSECSRIKGSYSMTSPPEADG